MQGPPMVIDIAGPISGPLCVVYRTLRATRGDVGAADQPEVPLLDRAGRPLVLTYGFICRGSRVVAPHYEDLHIARNAAVATYRRFHAAEETFPPETSRPYPVRSTMAPVEAAPSGSAAPRPSPPAEPAHSWPDRSPPPALSTPHTLPSSQQPAPDQRRPIIVMSLIVVAALALLGLALRTYVFTGGRHVSVKVTGIYPERKVTGETIRALVTTNGIAGQGFVIWGRAKNKYTNTSRRVDVTADTKAQPVSISAPGLTSGDHFRIRVKTNTGVSAQSSDQAVP